MIVFTDFFRDFLFHFLVILGLLYAIFYIKKMNFVYIALIVSAVVTYINHTFYPHFRLVEVLEIFSL
jgi:hypothetical protein